MAEVLLFHHALGLTEGVLAFADGIRQAGHTVHTPDLYDGHTFTTVDEGLAYARKVGVQERGVRAAADLPTGLVYGGFSLGVMAAQQLAQTRPGARGALFFHSCLPVEEFGDAWPADVPVQIHAKEADPFFVDDGDLEAAQALVASAPRAELFVYPGNEHLFLDSGLADFDAEATELVSRRVKDFLAAL
ncbi:dienelactone hydrolase family protein [Actinoplanes friuliensis]|uniref:Dienelactone hydrolase n=1 Tax=Actinoplanes friuliensis DSM 7358 TaxID=1246995 RepID=U5W790_9ACTN|nr:dienelactone hydrolase family protein [Actinoplanes friuliensis]AGZ45009.1 dienelactone hydrolase [Actinoplanes friuliensis DSM 7358]